MPAPAGLRLIGGGLRPPRYAEGHDRLPARPAPRTFFGEQVDGGAALLCSHSQGIAVLPAHCPCQRSVPAFLVKKVLPATGRIFSPQKLASSWQYRVSVPAGLGGNSGHESQLWPFFLRALSAGGGPAFAGLKNSDCLDCHGDNTLFKTNSAGKAVSMFVDAAKLKLSAHATNACISCHADVTTKHPDDNKTDRAGQLRAVPRAADGQLQRQRPRPRAQGRPRRRGDLPRLPRFARDHLRQLADLADLFFTPGGDLRRVPRQGGARLGAERSRQGGGRRFAGRADLHGLP